MGKIERGSTDIINLQRGSVSINFAYRGNILIWSRSVVGVPFIIQGFKSIMTLSFVDNQKPTYQTLVKINI